jgi:hypothetical protein
MHRHVKQANVGLLLLPEPESRFAIVGLRYDLEVVLGAEQVRKASPHDRVVIHEQETNGTILSHTNHMGSNSIGIHLSWYRGGEKGDIMPVEMPPIGRLDNTWSRI